LQGCSETIVPPESGHLGRHGLASGLIDVAPNDTRSFTGKQVGGSITNGATVPVITQTCPTISYPLRFPSEV